jgi:tetratricopeptide (TPR) repeat protein
MSPLPGLAVALYVAVSAVPGPRPMPITGLIPARVVPDLCRYSYRVSTPSADCQALCDQGFGYYYSYVWMEAARSFETALRHDPDCAMAWLGLHKALDKWGKSAAPKPDPVLAVTGGGALGKLPERMTKPPRDYALDRAKALLPNASHREQLLVTARLHEKGLMPGTGPDDRRKKAQQTLDELIAVYPDDQEGWFARGQLADGPHGSAAYYHALLRVNPIHPGAAHEFVHFYENVKRPALGWPFAEAYMKSSPGLPHAFHMQAHLAMRVGKWKHTTDWSARAAEMERAYHKMYHVKPDDDHQWSHHLETLTRALAHDGRFPEAKAVRAEARGHGYKFTAHWFHMAVAEKDWPAAAEQVTVARKANKFDGAYYGAILAIEQNDLSRGRAEFDGMRQAQLAKRGDKRQELRLLEVQGRLMCRTGDGEAGLKLLRRAVDKTKDDYAHHAWGGGAYYMEVWGGAALDAGDRAEAEEAFQEALAHDPGSVRGALGLWAVCDRAGRADEAAGYLAVARTAWKAAPTAAFEAAKGDFAARAGRRPRAGLTASLGP